MLCVLEADLKVLTIIMNKISIVNAVYRNEKATIWTYEKIRVLFESTFIFEEGKLNNLLYNRGSREYLIVKGGLCQGTAYNDAG